MYLNQTLNFSPQQFPLIIAKPDVEVCLICVSFLSTFAFEIVLLTSCQYKLNLINEYLEPTFWTKKFSTKKDDVQFVNEVLERAGL